MTQRNTSGEYIYDAFISYRHLPLDETIAAQIQKKLEAYRPPKSSKIKKNARINRIFRDKTELPNCGDLTQALRDALDNSRYLIVILSEETKNSKWCMEEIRVFKEAHGGRINNILPVLVSGDPQVAIPDLLRYETKQGADGSEIDVEVEPLCCDVRAASIKKSCARLRTEILRLAAPILDCGFDDLYQRHHRRNNRIKLLAMAAMAAILGVISVFAYTSYVAEQRYERNLIDTYTRQGAEQLLQGDEQKSLMYYASALQLDPTDQAAKTGALLLLQQNHWLHLIGREEGLLVDGRPFFNEGTGVLAMNRDGSKTLIMGYTSSYLGDGEGSIQNHFDEYGEFISSADDGSCWSFADEESVYFYFTDDGEVWQVPRPTKIHPYCDKDTLDLMDNRLTAMAVNRERAVIRYGGYLYLYNLLSDGQAELYCEFDLENVFPDADTGGLDVWNDTWIDDGGELAVLYNNAHAAVFDVNNSKDPCLNSVLVNYGFGLNDVAFSDDGRFFAVVYGNEYGIDNLDPGGFLEVYDQYGTLCMTTPFEPAVALAGADFEPGGTRILAWGSSVLQIWDYETGEPVVAPLRLERISSAAWGEDGSILVDDGCGTLSVFKPVMFEPQVAAPTEAEVSDEANVLVYEAAIGSGLTLNRTAVEIWLENEAGERLDTAEFEDAAVAEELFVNRMYLDSAASVGYFWFNGQDKLYRISVDEDQQAIKSSEVLDTHGWAVVGMQACNEGAVAVTGNGYLLYYTPESTTPVLTLQLGRSGIVKAMASDDSGLLAVILRSTEYISPTDSFHFEYRYSMELWDLNMGVRLGDLEDGSAKLEDPGFTMDGWLTYQKDGKTVALLLDAQNPDRAAAEYLADISCYRLNDEQFVETKPVEFSLLDSGMWNGCLRMTHDFATEGSDRQSDSLTRKLEQILLQEGTEAWLKNYDEIWTELSQSDMTAAPMKVLFENYFMTALNNGCEDQLRRGFECVIGKLKECGPKDYAHLSYSLLFTRYALTSKAYDDLLIDYWLFYADQLEAQLDSDSEEWWLDFASIYEYRLYAGLLKGEGREAFFSAIDEVYHDHLADILEMSRLDSILWLISGRPDMAAESIEELLEGYDLYGNDPEEVAQQKEQAFLQVMFVFNMFEQRGVIAEKDLSALMDYVSQEYGLRLKQVSHRNLEDGLRLNDLIIAVDGVRISNNWQLYEFMEKYPSACLTLIRDGDYLVTDTIEDWMIVGEFDAG